MQKHSFSIYDASAGSGKTYTLVKEYLKIILLSKKPDAYRTILAITFTNKAVHEMKSRVLYNLSEFRKEQPSDKALKLMQVIRAETGLSLPSITEKAQSIIKNLIHNYAAFDITTIDKFTHKVIRTFAHDLGLPFTFEVSLDTDVILNEAADAIIAEAGNDEELTRILVDYSLEKTNDDKSWDISKDLLETGKLILNENNREEITSYNKKTITEFLDIKTRLQELSEQLDTESSHLAKAILDLIESKGIDTTSFSRQHFPKHLESIVEKKFNPNNKTYYEYDDIVVNKTAKDKELIEAAVPQFLEMLKIVYQKLEKKNFYNAFIKQLTPLSLLNKLSLQFAEVQKEQNVLSIAEFNKLIYEQIQNQPAPFIYERLGEKYRHFFIDEFQDTSEMQWHNLIPLIDNATSSMVDNEKGTLMIVGDPKQSIYRWRGGKAEQFIALNKGGNPFNNPDLKLFSLETNWRSYSNIIEFNNNFFKFLSNKFEYEDYKNLYKEQSHQKTNDKTGGYVTIQFLPKLDRSSLLDGEQEKESLTKIERYFESILNKITLLKAQGFHNKDIAILTRNKKPGIETAKFLTQNGIPVFSSESLLLSASSEVQFLIHVLRYLKNKKDQEAKANVLYYLAKNIQRKLPIHDFMAQGMELKEEHSFSEWLQSFDLVIDFETIRQKSLYETTELLISTCIAPSKQNAYVQFFLDTVLERDIKNQSGIAAFLHYWEINADKLSIPAPEENDAIKIMTIHKSKGLEFPVVIFPFADDNYSHSMGETIWVETNEEELGLPKVLVQKSKEVKNYGEKASATYHQKKQEDLLDNVNVLYVALTRAEEQLHIISQQVVKNQEGNYPNTMATFFQEYLEQCIQYDESKLIYEFGDSKKVSPAIEVVTALKIIPTVNKNLDKAKIKIAQRESLMWNTKQQQAIAYGNIIHEVLSYVKTKNDVESAVFKAIEKGLINCLQKTEVLLTINQIVHHEALVFYFEEGNQVVNERIIIQKDAGMVKPDRMVITPKKEVYLLDYKTGLHQTKHRDQLDHYQKAIEQIGYNVTKKALVYIGDQLEVVNLHP
jgi:ATP-dependent exoDNAse (exonuclease V) beta subunit